MKTLITLLFLCAIGIAVIISRQPPPPPPPPPGDSTPEPPKPQIPSPPPATNADVSTAWRGLSVIALAQENYSVKRGGAGMENFSPAFPALTNQLNWQWLPALMQGTGSLGHLEGYQFVLTNYPDGDFQSNYLAIARPASGYIGPELRVDKRRVVWTNETSAKRSPKPPMSPQPQTPPP